VGETGYDACRAIRDTEHVDISNAVDMYDRWLLCSRSRDTRHMRRRSIAAAVQHGDSLGNLVSFGSQWNYTIFLIKESVPVLAKV